MKKVIRLTESELVNVIKKVLSEQTPYGFKEPISYRKPEVKADQYDDTEFDSPNFNWEKRESLRKKLQIQDIIDNFEDIDCDNYNLDLNMRYPEHLQIYCDSYRGRSKKYMQNLLNSL